ncbi:MAG: PAS domain-containing protein [Desulfobacteraceae bacterium]|nr:MAG: PAS domain-containing protein [Desulfobacteraceae bacterium]
MVPQNMSTENFQKKLPLHLAIVGGGNACKFFIEHIQGGRFPYLDIKLVGVCDIDPEAEGLRLAKSMGIYTTPNFRDLFKMQPLDGIIELTGREEVLLELIRHRPRRVAVIEHNIGKLLRTFFEMSRQLESAEQQIESEKMIANFLIEQTNEGIVMLNPDFTIAEANDAYLASIRKTRDQVIGANCYRVMYGLEVPCSSAQPIFQCPMLETLRTGASAHVIHENHLPGGQLAYCELVTYPVKDPEGEIVKIIEIRRDITQEFSSRWEKRVDELRADLRKMVQEDRMISLGKLAASCVHEINNPIQGLVTFSHLMQKMLSEGAPDSADLKEFKEYLTLMASELERCGDIVSGLLSFSRESPMVYKSVDLNQIIETVTALTRHRMALQNIELILDLTERAASISGDISHLQQCFLNLIFNAIEAMPRGGRLTVSSCVDTTEKQVRIQVRDTGDGIAQENLDHIFDPFFTTKAEGEGTGLGLSIVYGVVKNHGGHVCVESASGKGTLFSLNFPTL